MIDDNEEQEVKAERLNGLWYETGYRIL